MTDQPKQLKTILLVEDELPFRKIYKDALKMTYGYEIAEAEDGEEAMELVKQKTPDLILLDLVLPKLNGFDVLARIKNDPDLTHIPVIVYSVMADKASIERAMKLGASDFTIKGVTPAAEVTQKVRQLLGP